MKPHEHQKQAWDGTHLSLQKGLTRTHRERRSGYIVKGNYKLVHISERRGNNKDIHPSAYSGKIRERSRTAGRPVTDRAGGAGAAKHGLSLNTAFGPVLTFVTMLMLYIFKK